jgi:periplasmic protein TonB
MADVVAIPEAEPDPPADAPEMRPPAAEADPFGPPDPAIRIPRAARIREPVALVWLAAFLVVGTGYGTLGWVAGHAVVPYGQVETDAPITVDLVEDPDKTAPNNTMSQQGDPTPAERPPQPEQQPSPASPPVPEKPPVEAAEPMPPAEKAEAEPPPEPAPEPEKPIETLKVKPKSVAPPPSDDTVAMIDPKRDVDLTFDDLAAAIKRQEQKQHEQQQKASPRSSEQQMTLSGGRSQIRAQGANGRSSEYARAVIAALIKTKPAPFAYRGEALVSFHIASDGSLTYLRVIHSSHVPGLDDVAVHAIRSARFPPPPSDATEYDRSWIITYVFE